MLNEFETALLTYLTKEELTKIQNTKIGIAGCGGLGSNIAVSLVRTGFINLEIIDFDHVELSNLNRQYFFLDEVGQPKIEALKNRLKKINPDVNIKSTQIKLTRENITNYFKAADFIFEAFDQTKAKLLLFEAFGNSNKILIFGSGLAGYSTKDALKIKKIKKNIYLVGDQKTEANKSTPPLAPRVIICANLMAATALELVLASKF
ncbi:MAG: sulfur carrier protein ThiS adenylyltransferase ThiF [Candidatus Margulisiibacteriota bacterium]|jgi:sulfur carrier protein ThiS adenylyltransferase